MRCASSTSSRSLTELRILREVAESILAIMKAVIKSLTLNVFYCAIFFKSIKLFALIPTHRIGHENTIGTSSISYYQYYVINRTFYVLFCSYISCNSKINMIRYDNSRW
jgi:hypothetical protein